MNTLTCAPAVAATQPVRSDLWTDRERYEELALTVTGLIRTGQLNAEHDPLLQEIETLKNRHGGMPPAKLS